MPSATGFLNSSTNEQCSFERSFRLKEIGEFQTIGKMSLPVALLPAGALVQAKLSPDLDRSLSFSLPKVKAREIKQGKNEIAKLQKYIRSFLGDTIEKDFKDLTFNAILESMIKNELKKYSKEQIELLDKIDEIRSLVGHPIRWVRSDPANDYIWKDDQLGFHAVLDQNGEHWTALISIQDENGKYKPMHTIQADYSSPKKALDSLTEQIEEFRIQHAATKVDHHFGKDEPAKRHFLANMVYAIKKAGRGMRMTELATDAVGHLKWPGISEGFHVAGFVGLPVDAYRSYLADKKLKHYKENKTLILECTKQGKIVEAKLLERQSEKLLHSAAGKLFFSTTNATTTLLQGATAIAELASATVGAHAHAHAVASTAVTAAGAAAGGLIVATSIIDAIVNTVRFYKKSERKELISTLQRNISTLKTSAENEVDEKLLKKYECMERFLMMQRKIVGEKILFNAGEIGMDVALCTVGSLLIVASVTGATSAGIGAGAVAGGVVLGALTMVATDYVRKKRRGKKETMLREINPQRSNLGTIVELSAYLSKELEDPNSDQSISKYICQEYFKIEPYLLVGATKELVEKYRQAMPHHEIP